MDSLGKCLVIVGLIAMLTAGWTDSLVLVTLSLGLNHLCLFPHVFPEHL